MRVLGIASLFACSTVARGTDIAMPPRLDTVGELAAYASHVVVKSMPLVLPNDEEERVKLIWAAFADKPEQKAFAGVTTNEWEKKWDLLAEKLTREAAAQGLEAESLRACLKKLNRGRNEKTNLVPFVPMPYFPPGTPNAEVDAAERAWDAKNRKTQADARAHPEDHVDTHLATIPIGAYFVKHAGGECWIIACKWEDIASDGTELTLGHTRMWAVDIKSLDFLAFETCD